MPGTPFPFDLERAIDDWVFLIFFVGNDFLPHLPSLEIREGAIDTLIRIWKAELPRMGGYVTNHGRIELARAEVILEGLAKSEDDIFRKRREGESSFGFQTLVRRIEMTADLRRVSSFQPRLVKRTTRSVVRSRRTVETTGSPLPRRTPEARTLVQTSSECSSTERRSSRLPLQR